MKQFLLAATPPPDLDAPESSGDTSFWPMLILFLLAGLLVGGTWSAYQNGGKITTVVMAVLAVLACAAAILWMVGAIS